MTRCTSKTKTGRRCAGSALTGCTTCTFHTPPSAPVEIPQSPTFAEISAIAAALLAEQIAGDPEGRAEQLQATSLVMSAVWNWGFGALQYAQVLLIERLRERMHALAAIDA